jgi:N-acetylglucosamine-6-phosphate deacetylase
LEQIQLKNCCLVGADEIVQGDILLRGGLIESCPVGTVCKNVLDCEGKYVVPGFVDIHFHGYNLFDFTLGKFNLEGGSFDDSTEAFVAGINMLRKTLAGFGVTRFYIASFAASIAKLSNCFGNLSRYLQSPDNAVKGARLEGGLLEGSFINPQMAGAQSVGHILEMSSDAFEQIDGNSTIKLVNVVPDFGHSSMQLIKYLSDKGIVVGFGHTDATCNQIAEAIGAGLKYCIHFTNGPTGGSYKVFNGGGAIEGVLKSDDLYAELIADGYHVNPEYLRDIIARKGVDKIIGVTDCMLTAGSALKRFDMLDVKAQVSANGQYISVAGADNTLCGSNLTMNRGFGNILNLLSSQMNGVWYRQHKAMPFAEALRASVKMYSSNPCEVTGLSGGGYGVAAPGKRADLCVLDIQGEPGDYTVEVETTIVDGQVVYSSK